MHLVAADLGAEAPAALLAGDDAHLGGLADDHRRRGAGRRASIASISGGGAEAADLLVVGEREEDRAREAGAASISGTSASAIAPKPFMSQAPRPWRRPSRSRSVQGSEVQGWPVDRHDVGVAGEDDAAGDRGADQGERARPWCRSGRARGGSRRRARRARPRRSRPGRGSTGVETVGKATSRASISRGVGPGAMIDPSMTAPNLRAGPRQRQPEVSRLSRWDFCCLVMRKRPAGPRGRTRRRGTRCGPQGVMDA